MKIKILILFLSLVSFASAEDISFSDLVKLASDDIGKSIVVDRSLVKSDYIVDFDFSKKLKKGDIFEFLQSVLDQNNMFFEPKGSGYIIRKDNYVTEPVTVPELPVIPDNQKVYYYSYRIKNITNQDVVRVMSIFTDEFKESIKFTYLKQSDMIAYRSTKAMHQKIRRMLLSCDNTVISRTIRITLFTTNRSKLLSYGSNIRAFNYDFSSQIDGILSALKSGNSQRFNIKDSASLSFSLFALQGRGLAKINQEPTLLVTNGIKANVDYVKNISYKVSSVTRKENVETTTDQLKYRDVGFKLSILPKIKDNWVYLDLNLISEELLTPPDNQTPVTQKISYKNSLKVYKGKPVLLTGLKKTSQIIQKDGVPILGDLPFIGELFKKKKVQNDMQNINILVEVL